MSKEQKIVAWFLPKKALIKFDGGEDSFSVGAKVMEVADFEKYPIVKGDNVDVTIENNEVVFLRKVSVAKKVETKTEEKKEEVVKTSSNNSTEEVKKLKVVGVFNNESIKFNEKINNKQWCKLSDELKKSDLKSIGFVANNEVEITLKDGIIVAVKSIGVVKNDTADVQSTNQTVKKGGSYRDEDATDRRTALMVAKDIAVAYINSKAEVVNTVEKTEAIVSKLTESFLNLIKK